MKCTHCGAALADGASFCPYCEAVLIEKHAVAAPRPRKRRWSAVIVAALCVCALFAAASLLPRGADAAGKDEDIGAELVYEADGETFYLTVSFANCEAAPFDAEAIWGAEFPAGEYRRGSDAVKLYVSDGDGQNARQRFLEKLAGCTVTTAAINDGMAAEAEAPVEDEEFPTAALASTLRYDSETDASEIRWTLHMKNGDTLCLRQQLNMISVPSVTYTAEDAPMETIEELNALLARIEREVELHTIVMIELPAVTYAGGLRMENRVCELHGSEGSDGARTTFTDTVTVCTRSPQPAVFTGLTFAGSGGTGIEAYEGVFLENCTFTGWDTAAAACDGGWVGATNCRFYKNGTALLFNNQRGYTCSSTDFSGNLFEENGTALRVAAIPGSGLLDFTGAAFRANTNDAENPAHCRLALPEGVSAR